MADISNITVSVEGVNTVCEIKDKVARNDIAINRTTLGVQCKNLLKNNAVTQTVNGVTFTVNTDGSVTVNGTNTSSSTGANLEICGFKNYGDIKLTASLKSTDSNVYMSVFDKNWVGVGIICDNEVTWDNDNKERYVRLVVKPGATANNVTVYPMIRYIDITDDTYEPYKENIDERLIKNKSDIAVNKTTLGTQCKNLLPYSKSTVKGGITFTCDENGYMTTSNTTSDVRQFAAYNSQYNVKLKPGKYILSFVSASVCTNAYGNIMVLSANDEKIADIGQTNYYNKTSGAIEFTIDTEQTVYIMSKIFDGKTAIMLRDADITDGTYEPYQPSLKEQVPYSISLPSKSTSESYSYNGVPTMICLTPSESVSSGGGLCLINSVGTAVYLIDKTGIVINTDTTNKTFTITNNTASTYDVYISCAYKKE